MKLFFVADATEPEYNRDLFVIAETIDEVLAQWRSNYEMEGEDRPERIFLVPASLQHFEAAPRVLEWHQDLTCEFDRDIAEAADMLPKFTRGDRVRIPKIGQTKTVHAASRRGNEWRYILKGDNGTFDEGWWEHELQPALDWLRPIQWSTGEPTTFAPYDDSMPNHHVQSCREWEKVTGDNFVAVDDDGTIMGCEDEGYPTIVNVPEGGAA